jgi:hypothetical protein
VPNDAAGNTTEPTIESIVIKNLMGGPITASVHGKNLHQGKVNVVVQNNGEIDNRFSKSAEIKFAGGQDPSEAEVVLESNGLKFNNATVLKFKFEWPAPQANVAYANAARTGDLTVTIVVDNPDPKSTPPSP